MKSRQLYFIAMPDYSGRFPFLCRTPDGDFYYSTGLSMGPIGSSEEEARNGWNAQWGYE